VLKDLIAGPKRGGGMWREDLEGYWNYKVYTFFKRLPKINNIILKILEILSKCF